MRKEYCVLSRVKGRQKWDRHIPGHSTEDHAWRLASGWSVSNPDREYTVREFDCLPAPTYPNGQVRGASRRCLSARQAMRERIRTTAAANRANRPDDATFATALHAVGLNNKAETR